MLNINAQKLNKDFLIDAVSDNGLANQVASRYGEEGREAIESYRIVLSIACGGLGNITEDDKNWAMKTIEEINNGSKNE